MPYPYGFTHRKPIKISTAGIPASTLTDFSKLVKISGDTNIGAVTTSQKLAVVAADGTTLLPYGALKFVSSGGSCDLILRYKQTLLSSWTNNQTVAYILYGDDGTDQSNKSGVLDANTVGYWPLEEDPSGSAPQINDWSGNHHGTMAGSMASGASVAGQVGNSLNFDGVDDVIDCGNIGLVSAVTATIEAIIDRSSTGDTCGFGLSGGFAANRFSAIWFSDGIIYVSAENAVIDSYGFVALAGTGRHSVMAVFDGGQTGNANRLKVFIDGTPQTLTFAGNGNIPAALGNETPFTLGKDSANRFCGGNLDEASAHSVARSADWAAYRHTDHFSNSSTFTLGTEETAGGVFFRRNRFLRSGSRGLAV